MPVWNPDAAVMQPAGDITVERAAEVYEVLPSFARGTGPLPFLFSAAAGTLCPGSGDPPTLTILPGFLPADLLKEWTPYIRLRKTNVGGADVTATFTYQCSPDGDWATRAYPLMNATLPAPAPISMQLTAIADGADPPWTLVRLPPILGTDGFIRITVSNPGATPAEDITVWAGAIWRP